MAGVAGDLWAHPALCWRTPTPRGKRAFTAESPPTQDLGTLNGTYCVPLSITYRLVLGSSGSDVLRILWRTAAELVPDSALVTDLERSRILSATSLGWVN